MIVAAVCVVSVLLESPTATVLPFDTVVFPSVVLPVKVLSPPMLWLPEVCTTVPSTAIVILPLPLTAESPPAKSNVFWFGDCVTPPSWTVIDASLPAGPWIPWIP